MLYDNRDIAQVFRLVSVFQKFPDPFGCIYVIADFRIHMMASAIVIRVTIFSFLSLLVCLLIVIE